MQPIVSQSSFWVGSVERDDNGDVDGESFRAPSGAVEFPPKTLRGSLAPQRIQFTCRIVSGNLFSLEWDA